MGFRDRINKALRQTKEPTVTLECRRCGQEVEASFRVVFTLLSVAAGRESAQKAALLEEALSHPCREPGQGWPWDFTEVNPARDGTLAQGASAINRSRRRVSGTDEEPDV